VEKADRRRDQVSDRERRRALSTGPAIVITAFVKCFESARGAYEPWRCMSATRRGAT